MNKQLFCDIRTLFSKDNYSYANLSFGKDTTNEKL